MLDPKQIAEMINHEDNKSRLGDEFRRYEMFHGQIRKYVKEAILKEYLLPETVRNMAGRIVPINVIRKVVTKLAKIYVEPPLREPEGELPSDYDFIDSYEMATEMNTILKDANNYFKLSKHFAIESFANKGTPRLRTLAPYTYTPISSDPIDPTEPTYIVKHLNFGNDKKAQKHIVWSDLEHYTMNGEGIVFDNIDNEEGLNPYAMNPIYYGRLNRDQLIPIADDDLVSMQLVIALLLTDLNFAAKFASWDLLYIIGGSDGRLNFNPNTILNIPKNKDGTDPTIGSISRALDVDGLLRQIEAQIGLLLTTKSLSAGDVSGTLQAGSMASGVSKLFDSAESTEDRSEQITYFEDAEQYLFKLLKRQMPVWREAGELNQDWAKLTLSDDFNLSLVFPEQRPMRSESQVLEDEIKKLANNLTTPERALSIVNPDLSEKKLEALAVEIKRQQKLKQQEVEATNGSEGEVDG